MPRHKFTSETAKEANKASRQSARRNRKWKDYVKAMGRNLITMTMPDGNKEEMTWDMAVIASAYRGAINGDDKARQFIGKLNGQLDDTQNLNVTAKVKSEQLSPEEAAEFIAELNSKI